MQQGNDLRAVRMMLSESGGRASQDLGLGRIVGQILVYLYLQPTSCSLEELENDLALSKASVSIAARQLEQLGLVQRVWIKGERKKYYRSTENIGQALQQGLLSLLSNKVADFGNQLEVAKNTLDESGAESSETDFLKQRIARAGFLQKRLDKILSNPLTTLFIKK